MTACRWILSAAVAVFAGSQPHVGAGPPARLQSPDEPILLTDGATFERPAASGDTHRYAVLLAEGDFFEITASQDQLLARLSVRSPDGELLRTINLPTIGQLPQHLMFVASASGRYVVEVYLERALTPVEETESKRQTSGDVDPVPRCRLDVLTLRPATSNDRERARVFGVLEKAEKLARLQTMDGLRKSIAAHWEAAAGWRAVGDAALETSTLESLANVTAIFAQFSADSVAARERLTMLYSRMGNRELEIYNFRHLAREYAEIGRLADAKEAAGRALELALAVGFRSAVARSQRDVGHLEFKLGNYDRARTLSQQTQEIAASIPDPALEAQAAWDLARLDELAGDLDAAVARNLRGLELAAGNRSVTNTITLWLGFLHLRRGELDEAASRFEARLTMARASIQRDQEALARLGLGDVALARGDRESARRSYHTAASALEKGAQPFRCIAEQRLGRMDLEDGLLDAARARFATMLDIATRWQDPPCEAEGRAGLADVAARRGDLETADTEARRVVELAEEFGKAAGSPESRSLGFGALAPAYDRAIEISMRRADRGDARATAQALTLNEQALARGLLDKVSETRLDSRARVPGALAQAHQQVRERWRARLAELQVAMRVRPDAAETKALIGETRGLAVRVRDLEAQIDAADPRHASFLRPRPLGVDAIRALLDEGTVLLEYGLGDARSYLWVVSPREIRAFTLPPRAEIEALARRVHDGFARSAPTRQTEPASDAWDRRALTRLLLEPAALLLGSKRLVLVLPGALSLVPFGALPQPGADAALMFARHEIVQIPSATILGAMRSLTAGRARPSKTLAIFADPIFDATDPRLRSASTSPRRDRTPPPSALRLPGLSLTRLPFSRDEAEAIAALAPTSVSTFLGLDATRERVLERALADYRFIHFATHGVVNQDVPTLSSLILSLVDRTGRPRDGLVMLPDIYDMTLNADVVVLSGCQTALGKQVRGEGPIGLARAFMYAGVPRVVASLWPVDDLATTELMKRFYRGMLVDGLPPAAALRTAQRELATSRRWASPYFWAPFVLQGDWR